MSRGSDRPERILTPEQAEDDARRRAEREAPTINPTMTWEEWEGLMVLDRSTRTVWPGDPYTAQWYAEQGIITFPSQLGLTPGEYYDLPVDERELIVAEAEAALPLSEAPGPISGSGPFDPGPIQDPTRLPVVSVDTGDRTSDLAILSLLIL